MCPANRRKAGSSSATRMVSRRPRAAGVCPGSLATVTGLELAGKNTINVVPLPTSLSTSIQPWCCLAMPYTVARPSPVPFPVLLVVKNGSKILGRTSGAIPQPLSLTARQTNTPGRASGFRFAASPSSWQTDVLMVSCPPLGMASRALTTRFRRICSIMATSPLIPGRSCAGTNSMAMSAPSRRATILAVALMTSFKLSSCNCICCLRLKVSSWRVKPAARLAAAPICLIDSSASLPWTMPPSTR